RIERGSNAFNAVSTFSKVIPYPALACYRERRIELTMNIYLKANEVPRLKIFNLQNVRIQTTIAK
ncbi:hypothetical protein ACYTR9_22200, partial [Vibrio antiquarius]